MFAERVAFLIVIGLVLLYAAIAAAGFPDRARIFPQLVASAGLLLVAVELARLLWRRFVRLEGDDAAVRSAVVELRAGAPYVGWLLGYYAAIWLVGFLLASLAFVLLFLTLVARVRLTRALLAAAVLAAGLLLLQYALEVRWPAGALPERVALAQLRVQRSAQLASVHGRESRSNAWPGPWQSTDGRASGLASVHGGSRDVVHCGGTVLGRARTGAQAGSQAFTGGASVLVGKRAWIRRVSKAANTAASSAGSEGCPSMSQRYTSASTCDMAAVPAAWDMGRDQPRKLAGAVPTRERLRARLRARLCRAKGHATAVHHIAAPPLNASAPACAQAPTAYARSHR